MLRCQVPTVATYTVGHDNHLDLIGQRKGYKLNVKASVTEIDVQLARPKGSLLKFTGLPAGKGLQK